MNKFIFTAVLISILVFSGCDRSSTGQRLEGENLDKDTSYALGMLYGTSMISEGLIPNVDEFMQGIKDYLSGEGTRFNEMEAYEKIETAYMAIMEAMEGENMQEGIDFLVQNSRKPGVIITPSGLQYEVITEGTGPKPNADSVVRVHYEGTLINGQVFDSSYNRGEPIEFPLNRVIPGWTEGVQLMSVGSKYKFYIPQELGYGAQGGGPIPPYSTLIFEVELLGIVE